MNRFLPCFSLFALLSLSAVSGCAGYSAQCEPPLVGAPLESKAERAAEAADVTVALALGLVDFAEDLEAEHYQDAQDRADVEAAYAQPARTIPHLPAIETPRETPHVAFDAPAARDALAAVDPSSCAAHGVPAGYAHARVTFGSDGRVSAVAIDAPATLSDDAKDCLSASLQDVTAPAFDGAPITVGTSLLVR